MPATVKNIKCACGNCQCVFPIDQAFVKNGKAYCCEACTNNHQSGDMCPQCQSVCGCAS